jgi:hypothetical protein
MRQHPVDLELALLAGGDTGRFRRFWLDRHVGGCSECQEKIDRFQAVRSEVSGAELPELNWNLLAAEMRANIHLGLEAGACVRSTRFGGRDRRDWVLRFAAAGACVLVLAAAGFFLEDSRPREAAGLRSPGAAALASPVPDVEFQTPVLESSTTGVELRTGSNSLMLLNHKGAVANQTVSAQGAIRSRYIDGETGSVTINNVYLE